MRTVIASVLVFAVCAPGASARTWTDSTGTHTVEAEFVDFKDGKVRLRKEDGKTITVPIEKFSEADREFVRTQSAKKAAAETEKSAKPSAGTQPVEKEKLDTGPGHLEVTIRVLQSSRNGEFLVVTPSRRFNESEYLVITFVEPGSTVAHDQVVSIPKGRADDAVKQALAIGTKTGIVTHQVNAFNNGQFDFVCQPNTFGKQGVYAATNRYRAVGKPRFGSSTTYFMLSRWGTGEGSAVEIPLPEGYPGFTDPDFIPRTCNLRVWLIAKDGAKLAQASIDIKRK